MVEDLVTCKLIKYCNKETIQKYNSIRIGSLNYYRETDNDFIRDENEGSHENIHDPKVKEISAEFITSNSSITAIPAIPGTPFMTSPDSSIELHIYGKRKFQNFYVFCCTRDMEEKESNKDNFNRNSSYEITNIPAFIKTVQKFLECHLNTKYPDLKNCKLVSHHNPIRYSKNSNNEIIITTDCPSNYDVVFTKPKTSVEENEYRFIWMLYSENKIIDVPPPKHVDIPITDFPNCFNFNF